MTATSTAVALQSAAQEFADADARPPDPPGLGHAEDRNIADETQPGAIAKPGTETAETGAPGRTSGSVPAGPCPGPGMSWPSSPGLARNRLAWGRCCTHSAAAAPAWRCCA